MTATVEGARTRNRKPVCRKASYHRVNDRFGTLELTIGEGDKAETFGYYVEPIPSDFGRAFSLAKYRIDRAAGEPSEYAVLLDVRPDDADRPRHSCECKGWLRWSRCKHVASLLALVATGRI